MIHFQSHRVANLAQAKARLNRIKEAASIFKMAEVYAAEASRCKGILEGLYEVVVQSAPSEDKPIVFSVAKPTVDDIKQSKSAWVTICCVRNNLGGLIDETVVKDDGKLAVITTEDAGRTFEVEICFDDH